MNTQQTIVHNNISPQFRRVFADGIRIEQVSNIDRTIRLKFFAKEIRYPQDGIMKSDEQEFQRVQEVFFCDEVEIVLTPLIFKAIIDSLNNVLERSDI